MEEQQTKPKSTRGIGKEQQLSKIAATVNTKSDREANPAATQAMIATFVQNFNSTALDLINEIDDDHEDLIKKMVDEITKLQTKNMEEFEKAIGRIVGISEKLIESNNPKLQQLGQGMQDQAKEQLFKAKGITLRGDQDTFANRLGRQFGMDTEKEPIQKNVRGLGKLAKGFLGNIKSDLKRGAGIAFGADIEQEGTLYDRVVRSDEEKREREISKLDTSTQETRTETLAETFKKVIEEFFKESKKGKGSEESASDEQEDAAGISKDAKVEAAQKTAEATASIEKNTKDTVDVLNKILDEVKQISEKIGTMGQIGGGGDDGGFSPLDLDLPDRRRRGRGRGRGRVRGRGLRLRGRGRLLRMKAGRALRGARSFGGRVLGGARSLGGRAFGAIRSAGSGLFNAARTVAGGVTGTAVLAATGAAAATGAILYGVDKFIKGTNVEARKKQEEGTARFGLTGNNMDGFSINGKPAGKYKDLPEYYKNVADGYGANSRGGSAERARQYVETHNPDGSKKTTTDGNKKPATAKVAKATPKVTAPPETKGDEIVVTAPKKQKATVEKPRQETKPTSTSTVKEATAPKQSAAPSLDSVDKSIKGKVAEIDPNGRWAKLKDGKIVDPDFPNDADSNYTAQRAYKLSQKSAQVAPNQNNSGKEIASQTKKATAKPETGRNVDGTIVEAGTAATKEKMQINVPPPTVVQQNSGGGNSAPTITAPGGVRNVRADDPTWLRFQERRASY